MTKIKNFVANNKLLLFIGVLIYISTQFKTNREF